MPGRRYEKKNRFHAPHNLFQSSPLNAAVDSCNEILKLFATLPQRQGDRFQGSVPIGICHGNSPKAQKKGRIAHHYIAKQIQDGGNVLARL
jgi:hypothetical protein